MNKLMLALLMSVVFFFVSGAAHAQIVDGTHSNMRDLAIQSMQEYGQQEFDRADYAEAAAVFQRILKYDLSNANARHYLQQIQAKGVSVDIPDLPVVDAKPDMVSAQPVAQIKKSHSMVEANDDQSETKIMPVPTTHVDEDLAELQSNLHELRESLHAKTEQLNTLEQQLK